MDANTIDIIGQRNDGGLELVVVLDQDIDNLPDEQTQLLDKIENYMSYVESEEFKKDFPDVLKEQVTIILTITFKPSQQFLGWLEKIASWIQDSGIKYELSIAE